MKSDALKEIFDELFSHLERLETQSEGILQFLKEKKRVTEKQLAPYLEQAGNASNVRWRAARVRIERLLSSAEEEESSNQKKSAKPTATSDATPPAPATATPTPRPEAAQPRSARDQSAKPLPTEAHKEPGAQPTDDPETQTEKIAAEIAPNPSESVKQPPPAEAGQAKENDGEQAA